MFRVNSHGSEKVPWVSNIDVNLYKLFDFIKESFQRTKVFTYSLESVRAQRVLKTHSSIFSPPEVAFTQLNLFYFLSSKKNLMKFIQKSKKKVQQSNSFSIPLQIPKT